LALAALLALAVQTQFLTQSLLLAAAQVEIIPTRHLTALLVAQAAAVEQRLVQDHPLTVKVQVAQVTLQAHLHHKALAVGLVTAQDQVLAVVVEAVLLALAVILREILILALQQVVQVVLQLLIQFRVHHCRMQVVAVVVLVILRA
jgi:hypothetical protein